MPKSIFPIQISKQSKMVIKTPEVKYKQIFIDNEWQNSVSGKTFPTINPSNCKKIADIHEGDKADVDKAVKAARKAFELGSEWRTMDASARGQLIQKLADLIARDIDYIARLESLDNGKAYKFALNDIGFSINNYRYAAGYCDKLCGKTIPSDGEHFTYTRVVAIGVVGIVTPWNYPFLLVSFGVSAALCAGNCVVVKPAEQTPLTTLYLAALIKEAGFPKGVFNVVPGYGPTAGAALSEHMDIDKISFTGSGEIGCIIQMASAKSNLKKVTLELGGKNPLVIWSDANLDLAAAVAIEGCFYNHGQTCCASTRIYVHEDIHDQFVEKCVQLALKRKVGDPFQEDTIQGPQIDEEQFNKILGYIESGKKEGANLKTGGKRVGKTGYFVEPTIFTDVKDHMKICREEIFGPVMSVMKISSMDEAIQRANDTPFGLSAGIITNDVNNVHLYSQGVRAGSVWVNTFLALLPQAPFGGFKQSGIGRSLGEEGIKSYTECKTVTIKIPQKNS
ncbi:hypothetical protein CHUAL_003459 [Chamberlinius hualienensis]